MDFKILSLWMIIGVFLISVIPVWKIILLKQLKQAKKLSYKTKTGYKEGE